MNQTAMNSSSFIPGLEVQLQEKFNSLISAKFGKNVTLAQLQKEAKIFWSFMTLKKVNCHFPEVLISNFQGA
jgi:hypothetical protein